MQLSEMGLLSSFLLVFVSAAFTDNILLARFLGMCSCLGVSKKVDTSIGLGTAVAVVTAITATCKQHGRYSYQSERSRAILCRGTHRHAFRFVYLPQYTPASRIGAAPVFCTCANPTPHNLGVLSPFCVGSHRR